MALEVAPSELESYVGKETGVSDWFKIDQDRVNQFADVTLDHQFIHIDAEKAKLTPFGGTIAHGFLTLSLSVKLLEEAQIKVKGAAMGVNYGSDKVRFLSPVKVGQEVRARAVLASVDDKGHGRYLLKNNVTIEINGEDKPAMAAELLTMIFVQ